MLAVSAGGDGRQNNAKDYQITCWVALVMQVRPHKSLHVSVSLSFPSVALKGTNVALCSSMRYHAPQCVAGLLLKKFCLKGSYHEESNFPWSLEIKEFIVL